MLSPFPATPAESTEARAVSPAEAAEAAQTANRAASAKRREEAPGAARCMAFSGGEVTRAGRPEPVASSATRYSKSDSATKAQDSRIAALVRGCRRRILAATTP
jgi:hypothetical protein